MAFVQRLDIPTFLNALKDFNLDEFFDKEGEEFYEFIFKNYPGYLPDDSVTLHDIIDDITPQILLEYFLEKGYVTLC